MNLTGENTPEISLQQIRDKEMFMDMIISKLLDDEILKKLEMNGDKRPMEEIREEISLYRDKWAKANFDGFRALNIPDRGVVEG